MLHSRGHFLPPGQRGSGVELILLVDDVDAVYAMAKQAQADIVCELTNSPQYTGQFWVRHPGGYLIRPTQAIIITCSCQTTRSLGDSPICGAYTG